MRSGPRIAYIAAWGRSGSTLLGNVLGALPGVFDAGELRQFWMRMGREDHACGCGEAVATCSFWTEVRSELESDPEMFTDDLARIGNLHREATRLRNTLRVVRASETSDLPHAPFGEYITTLRCLYRAISRVSGDSIIVDGSQRIGYGALARFASDGPATLIHLIRDPRAAAYSWQRRMARGPLSDRQMARLSPLRSSVNWVLYNVGAEMLRRRVGRRAIRVRYEDFVSHPQTTLAGMLDTLQATGSGVPFLGTQEMDLPPNHAFAGNPSRFRHGIVTIANDDEWIREQNKVDRLVCNLVTFPLLQTYGYRLRVGGWPQAASLH
jgi:Sulfotransferase family